MPDFIVLGSNHKWFACYNLNEAINLAKEMFKDGCDYVTVIRNNTVVSWTNNDMNF